MAKITRVDMQNPAVPKRKRVAAYARVSIDTELMHHSISNQISYYSSFIQSNPEWEYAGVYADEGITGTSTRNRAEFKRLIKDCEDGLIDIVLVKSISRFARDTVDCLETTRHLKDIGVEVRFEREAISSMSSDGELFLTLLASFAQAESESISNNGKWAKRKKMAEGEPACPARCFGYEWDAENRKFRVVEEEAKWVRYIFDAYLGGASIKSIAGEMKEKNVTGLRGRPLGRTTIRRILTSEMYAGDLLLQKYFNSSVGKVKENRGELPQYLVSDAHEAIVSRDMLAEARSLVEMRSLAADNYGYVPSEFAGLIRCGKCGRAVTSSYHRNAKDPRTLECSMYKDKKCRLIPMKQSEMKRIMQDRHIDLDEVESITMYDERIIFRLKNGRTVEHTRTMEPGKSLRGKVLCAGCGSKMRRMKSGRSFKYGCIRKYSDKDACETEQISEDELLKACAYALGEPENIGIRICADIEKITVGNSRLEVYLRKGVKVPWERK